VTLLALALIIAAGHGLIRAVTGSWPLRLLGPLASAALSMLCGATAVGLLMTYAGVVGLSTRPWPLVLPLLIALAIAGVVPGRLAVLLRIDRSGSARPAGSAAARLADAAVAAAVTVVGTVLLWGIGHVPVRSNDEFAIWAVRGRTMALTGHLDPHVFTGVLANYQHLDYPLLVPSLIAWGDGLRGHTDDYSAHVLLIAVLLAMLAVVGWALNRVAGPFAGVAGVLLAAGTPDLLSRWALLLMADAALVAFVLAMFFVLALWLTDRDPRLLAIAAVLGCGAAATKVEGLLFVLACFAAALVCARGQRRAVLLGFGVAVASALPWIAWTKVHHIQSDLINSTTLTLHHLRVVAPYSWLSVRQMAHYWPASGWLLVIACLAVMAVALTVARLRGLVAFLGVAFAVSTLGMWAQYVISAGQQLTGDAGAESLRRHFGSSAPRVLLVPAMLLTLAAPLFAGALLRSEPKPAGDPAGADPIDAEHPAAAH
jgi:hypothetical protein